MVIKGKEYKNLRQACNDSELNKYKLSYNAIVGRINRGDKLDDLFDYGRATTEVVIKGKRYSTVKEACADEELNIHGLTYMAVEKRISRGADLETVFDTKRKHKNIIIKGKKYKDLREACNDTELNICNLEYKTVIIRLNHGYTLENVFDSKKKTTTIKVSINGKSYDTLALACLDEDINKNGLAYDVIARRIRIGSTIEEAFNEPNRRKSIAINIKGKRYRSLMEACRDKELNIHNLSSGAVYNRIKSGVSEEDAFNTPLQRIRKKGIVEE